jgi:hypothetical protein
LIDYTSLLVQSQTCSKKVTAPFQQEWPNL